MNRLYLIQRSIPYTIGIGACIGAVHDGYNIDNNRGGGPFLGIMCGIVVGATWPVLIPLGVLVESGYMMSAKRASKD